MRVSQIFLVSDDFESLKEYQSGILQHVFRSVRCFPLWLDWGSMFWGVRPQVKCHSYHFTLRGRALKMTSLGWGSVCQLSPLWVTFPVCTVRQVTVHSLRNGELRFTPWGRSIYTEFCMGDFWSPLPCPPPRFIYIDMDSWILILYFGL